MFFECLALVLAHGNSVQSFRWTYLDPVRCHAGLPGTLPGRYEAFPAPVDPLAAGCWLLATGYWLLVTGCWLLVTGCWLLAAGYRGLEAGIRTIGCWLSWTIGCGLVAGYLESRRVHFLRPLESLRLP